MTIPISHFKATLQLPLSGMKLHQLMFADSIIRKSFVEPDRASISNKDIGVTIAVSVSKPNGSVKAVTFNHEVSRHVSFSKHVALPNTASNTCLTPRSKSIHCCQANQQTELGKSEENPGHHGVKIWFKYACTILSLCAVPRQCMYVKVECMSLCVAMEKLINSC